MKLAFQRSLEQFVGVHTLLMGLFPFYLSVYLWQSGMSLSSLSQYVVLVALGFLLGMMIWDRLRRQVSGRIMVVLSLLLELSFLLLLWMEMSWISALLFGLYNGLFWLTQRMLFLDALQPNQSGRQFGNLQILVFLLLQGGIFLGGVLLESGGLSWVIGGSVVLSLLFAMLFLPAKHWRELPLHLRELPAHRTRDLWRFRDRYGSKLVFVIDGPFLYLEGFFWLVTLYQLTAQSYLNLGVVVIALAMAFAAMFWLLKNRIDALPLKRTYLLAVGLYSGSWVLRAASVQIESLQILGVVLLLLSFCTSFFRLTFNKRFFDLADKTLRHRYVYLKSWYSQLGMAGFFLLMSVMLTRPEHLVLLYLCAALGAWGFLSYRSPQS